MTYAHSSNYGLGMPVKRIKSVSAQVVAVLAATTVAVAMASGTASAEPTSTTESVGYHTSVTPDGAVRTVLDAGAFRIDASGSAVDIVGESGAVLAKVPLTYTVDGASYSIAPLVAGERQLSLVPQPASLVTDVAGPVTKQQALDNVIGQIGTGLVGGGAAGAAIGAALGLAIGCVSIFPNFISGCIIGTAIGVVSGTIIGTVNANPGIQPAVVEYFNTP
ncbi:hypothetical protein [Rhodococcoides yunnanense]|uniref:hypothetical protein n=1 Tax=Rhodococcoides yunnanense TaxID=278209 RepID=UPI001FE3DB94|nr:hypothetical protein [Rhodococcus yunnanensis]